MKWIPVPIVMAMIVGAMIKFGTGMITSLEGTPLIVGTAILVYLFSSRYIKKVPPILMSFVAGGILAAIMGEFQSSSMEAGFTLPQVLLPTFSFESIISVSIPLTLLVIGAENAQAIAS